MKKILSVAILTFFSVVVFAQNQESAIVYTTSNGKQVYVNHNLVQSHTFDAGKGEIILKDGISEITGDLWSSGKSNVTSIIIADCITTICKEAFLGFDSLMRITIPDSVTTIGEEAFMFCRSLTSVTISDSVTTIGNSAFAWCDSLTSVTIPNSVTTIGDTAFAYCRSLTSVTIPDSVTTIGVGAFEGCDSLTSVTIGDSVTTIEEAAFVACTNLTSVTIPNSVTTIGESAFSHCHSLKTVYCKPTTPPTGGLRMFNVNASGRKIYVPSASVSTYKAAKYWSDYASNIFKEEE